MMNPSNYKSIRDSFVYILYFVMFFIATTSGIQIPKKYVVLAMSTIFITLSFIGNRCSFSVNLAQLKILKFLTGIIVFLTCWNYFIVPTIYQEPLFNLKWLALIVIPSLISLFFILNSYVPKGKDLFNIITISFVVSTLYLLVVRETHQFNKILTFSIPESTLSFCASIFALYAYWKKDFKRFVLFFIITILFYKRAAILALGVTLLLDLFIIFFKKKKYYYFFFGISAVFVYYISFFSHIEELRNNFTHISSLFSGRSQLFLNLKYYWSCVTDFSQMFGNGFGAVPVSMELNIDRFPNSNSMFVDMFYSIGSAGSVFLLSLLPFLIPSSDLPGESRIARLKGMLFIHLCIIGGIDDPHIFLFDTISYVLVLFLAFFAVLPAQKSSLNLELLITTIKTNYKMLMLLSCLFLGVTYIKHKINNERLSDPVVLKSRLTNPIWIPVYQNNKKSQGYYYFPSATGLPAHIKKSLKLSQSIGVTVSSPSPNNYLITMYSSKLSLSELKKRIFNKRILLVNYLLYYKEILDVFKEISSRRKISVLTLSSFHKSMRERVLNVPELRDSAEFVLRMSTSELKEFEKPLHLFESYRVSSKEIVKAFLSIKWNNTDEINYLPMLTSSIVESIDFVEEKPSSAERKKYGGLIPVVSSFDLSILRLLAILAILLGLVILLLPGGQKRNIVNP